jgi:hypothetical protein
MNQLQKLPLCENFQFHFSTFIAAAAARECDFEREEFWKQMFKLGGVKN